MSECIRSSYGDALYISTYTLLYFTHDTRTHDTHTHAYTHTHDSFGSVQSRHWQSAPNLLKQSQLCRTMAHDTAVTSTFLSELTLERAQDLAIEVLQADGSGFSDHIEQSCVGQKTEDTEGRA